MNKAVLFLLLLLTIMASAYTIGWYYFAGLIDKQVKAFVEQQEEQGIEFSGSFTPVHGFPGLYKLVYSGDIIFPEDSVTVPQLEITGIPLKGRKITAIAPLGAKITTNSIPNHLKTLERAALTIIVPSQIPPEVSYPYLKVWQHDGHAKLKVPSFTLQWPDASIYGEGELRLNDDLQPEGEARLGVTNHNYFVTILAEEIGLSDNKKLMLLTFLNAVDNANGAIVLPFRLANNALYLNMIRLTTIPIIYWPGMKFEGRK